MGDTITAVIFDFEGTLVDFQWRLAAAEAELRAAFAAQGYGTAGNYAELWNAAAEIAVPQGRLAALRGALDRVPGLLRIGFAEFDQFGRIETRRARPGL